MELTHPVMFDAPPEPAVVRPQIEVRGLRKAYGANVILDGVDLEIAAGETIALIGPSGGGKSTLLRCLTGLNRFDGGGIRGGDEVLPVGNPRGAEEIRGRVRRFLGMIFQDFQLFPHRTALENIVDAPVHVLKESTVEARERGMHLLRKVGLEDRAGHYPRQLSGGQKQRVAIARALAMQPRGLLCDEITSALDPELKQEVLKVLEDLRAEGLTLVMVTHEIGFARRVADRVAVFAGGKIVEVGPAARVIDQPEVERTKRFLSGVLG